MPYIHGTGGAVPARVSLAVKVIPSKLALQQPQHLLSVSYFIILGIALSILCLV